MENARPHDKIVGWLLPSVPVLLFALLFWQSLFFMPQMINAGDSDLGRDLVVGNLILTSGHIPTADVFSHTMPGEPLVPKEWLSQVLFALAYRAAGMNGVAWLTALVISSTFTILASGLRFRVLSITTFACAYAASVVSAVHLLARTHIFTLLFFAIFAVALEDHYRSGRRRWLWLLPPMMLVWANIHGAFIAGIVLTAFYAIGSLLEKERYRFLELGGLIITLLLASLINPVGPGLLSHVLGALRGRVLIDMTVEYQSPNFHMISTWPFAALLLTSLVVALRSRQVSDWTHLGLVGGWMAFALHSGRNIPLCALVTVIWLAPQLEALIHNELPNIHQFLTRADRFDRLSRGWIWVPVVVAVLIGQEGIGARLDAWGTGNSFSPAVFPVAAVDWLEQSPPAGNMFNEFTWGGYMLYRLWPRQPVFIDGWSDFYGEALTREYLQTVNAEPGWQAVLERYKVQWVILPPNRPLAVRLEDSPEWMRQYLDGTAGVWVRR